MQIVGKGVDRIGQVGDRLGQVPQPVLAEVGRRLALDLGPELHRHPGQLGGHPGRVHPHLEEVVVGGDVDGGVVEPALQTLDAASSCWVCDAMARRGVLTRPIGNVIVLMPPYCTTPAQAREMVGALRGGIEDVFGKRRV